MITTLQIVWIAGLLEGEGCFYSGSRIALEMTDRDVVIKARNILCPTIDIKFIPAKNSNHQDKYRLNLCGNLAIQWMMTLYPLMGARRKIRIKEIITEWKNNGMGVRGSNVCGRGHVLEIFGLDFRLRLDGRKACIHCLKIAAAKYRAKKRVA